jgi:hypothetical protein
MGVLDIFKPQPQAPAIISILPGAAKQEIICGRLPILNTNKIFLKPDEQCHYIDKAIYEEKIVKKRYVRKNAGYSVPGIFKGTRVRLGGGQTDVVDTVQYNKIRGILYITNKRIIFVGESTGFDKKIDDLIALTPYINCVEFHFSKETYKIFIPDGNIAQMIIQSVK